jgi:hypothetical protein
MKICNLKRAVHRATEFVLLIFCMNVRNAVAQGLPPDVGRAFANATVAEDGSLTGPDDVDAVLRNYMRAHAFEVLRHFDSIAPTDERKIVLVRAAELLEPEDYLQFLKAIRDLRKAGKVSGRVFEWALGPSHYKEGFLAVNYQNSEIREFVGSVRPMLDSAGQAGLDEILSGQRKKELEERWSAEGSGPDEKALLLAPLTPSK